MSIYLLSTQPKELFSPYDDTFSNPIYQGQLLYYH